MILIAYNEEEKPIRIVNAKSQELAIAYWHGAGIIPHVIKTEKDFDFTTNGTGVVPILKTALKEQYNFTRDSKILTIVK